MRWKGFSSVEALLVLALSGILAVGAVLFLPSLGGVNLNSAAIQVRRDIEYARQNAMNTGQASGVVFVSSGSYTVYQGTVSTPLNSPLTLAPMIVTLSSSFPGVTISSSYTVEFDRTGKPSTGGGGSVTLSSGSSSATISVTANTGRVTIP